VSSLVTRFQGGQPRLPGHRPSRGWPWVGSFHAGRQTYLIEACEKNMLGLIDAASLKDEANDRAS
jgi:hypothetical protein